MSEAPKDIEHYKYKNKLSLQSKVARMGWNVCWSLLFRPTPSWGMNRWRILLLRVFGAKIGKGCRIAPTCRIWAPWNLEMGMFSCMGDHVDCYAVAPIRLGSKVAISQYSVLCAASHDIKSLHRPLIYAPISIDNHAWICAGAFIGPGVEIGEAAVIGARAVVFKNVDAWDVVAGNPASFVKKRVVDDAMIDGA